VKITLQWLIGYAGQTGADLGELGLFYERCISGMTDNEIIQKMAEIAQIIDNSINIGLKGTDYKDRILGQQSHLIKKAVGERKLKDCVITRGVSYVTALMESRSAMEVIVAFPTAGSTGTVGGLVFLFAGFGLTAKEKPKAIYILNQSCPILY
jgi:L-serine dehydratase